MYCVCDVCVVNVSRIYGVNVVCLWCMSGLCCLCVSVCSACFVY